MTATKMRATVQSTTRIATGIAVLDEVLVAFAKAAGARPPSCLAPQTRGHAAAARGTRGGLSSATCRARKRL